MHSLYNSCTINHICHINCCKSNCCAHDKFIIIIQNIDFVNIYEQKPYGNKLCYITIILHICSKMLKKEDAKPIARGRSSNSPCMIVFCAFEQLSTLIAAAKKHGFVNYIPLVFCKNYSPQVLKANMRIVGATEYALVLYRNKLPKFRNGLQIDENGKNIRGTGHMIFNWFTWEKDGKDIPKIHPAQKPVAVLKKLIEIFTDEGDVVIDPCCGSGSTLRAAAELGRSAYGFEIDRNFYERAKNEMLVFEKDEQMDISDFIGDTV